MDYPVSPKIYSAPRKFDLATMMVVTTSYALLYAGLRLVSGDYVGISVGVGVFITFVGLSQAFLFQGKQPRLASVLMGVLLLLAMIFYWSWTDATNRPQFRHMTFVGSLGTTFWGGLSGYLAGAIVGGVFLIADALRQTISKRCTPPTRVDP